MEAYYLRFDSAEIALGALRQLSETNIQQFGSALRIGTDPGKNPLYLELIMDYYQSWTVPAIANFLEVTITLEKDYKVIDSYCHKQAPAANKPLGKVLMFPSRAA